MADTDYPSLAEDREGRFHPDRRRRRRLAADTTGYLLPQEDDGSEPREIRILDLSRHGVGFIGDFQLVPGDHYRLRVGKGPMHLARAIRIVACRPSEDGYYLVGCEFLSAPLAKAS